MAQQSVSNDQKFTLAVADAVCALNEGGAACRALLAWTGGVIAQHVVVGTCCKQQQRNMVLESATTQCCGVFGTTAVQSRWRRTSSDSMCLPQSKLGSLLQCAVNNAQRL
jgi:hypothetical protein